MGGDFQITLFWGAYAVVTVSGVILVMLNVMQNNFSKISIGQLAYIIYLLLGLVLSLFLKSFAGAGLCLLIIICLFAVMSGVGEDSESSRKEQLERRIGDCRLAFTQIPDNFASMELIGDAFASVGDDHLARVYYKKALGTRQDPNLIKKLDDLPTAMTTVTPVMRRLRACRACERINYRTLLECAHCRQPFYPNLLIWAVVRFNRFYEDYSLQPITISGLVLLPIMFFGGALAYAVTWGIWAFGIAMTKS